jgi:hypothetical protein
MWLPGDAFPGRVYVSRLFYDFQQGICVTTHHHRAGGESPTHAKSTQLLAFLPFRPFPRSGSFVSLLLGSSSTPILNL